MLIHSTRRPWLSSLIQAFTRQSSRRYARRQLRPTGSRTAIGRRFGRRGELLEDRSLLSTITVTSLDDNTTVDSEVTLREAIQAANTNQSVDGSTPGETGPTVDIIEFANGLTGTILLTGTRFDITEAVTIAGPGANLLTIDAQNSLKHFFVSNVVSDATISGLTLINGFAGTDGMRDSASPGGAIQNAGTLTLDSVVISNSRTETSGSFARGGAIDNIGQLTLRNSTLMKNASGFGGRSGQAFPVRL